MSNGISVKMHQGRVMVDRLAHHYPDLTAVTEEAVQNGIDAKASRIDVSINLKKRTLQVMDNGSGAGREKMRQALESVGDTLKTEPGNYGQFGLGIFAALSIAKEFTIVSCPANRSSGYTLYEFVTGTIREQKEVVIPERPVEILSFDPSGETWWRTNMSATGITKDRRKSAITIGNLASSIAVKYGEKIRKQGIQVNLEIIDREGKAERTVVRTSEFSGDPLSLLSLTGRECGTVTVELFVARLARGGRKGVIAFGRPSNPSRISGKQFVDCTREILDATVSKAILSGIFEGVILCERVKLHADRTRFEDDDALFALCEALEEWYRKVGRKVVEETATQDSDNRFQRIGNSVMPYAELLLQQEPFKGVAGRIVIGTVGDGHAKVPKKLTLGKEDATSLASDGAPYCERAEGKEDATDDGRPVPPPQKERPEHAPGVVYGGRGRRRTEVKGSSTGLRFDYVEMDDFRTPFSYSPNTGALSFNIRHPNWGLCQQNDGFLQRYHILVVTTALTLESFRDSMNGSSPELQRFSFEALNHQVFAILNGEAMVAKK